MRNKNITFGKLLPFLTICFLIILVELFVRLGIVSKQVLPPPTKVIMVLIMDFKLIWPELLHTLVISVLGLFISCVIGLGLGLLMDRYSFLAAILLPLFIVSQTIPLMAIAPIFILWFGYGVAPKLIIIILICFFPITLNFYQGLQSCDLNMHRLLRSFGSSNWQIMRHLKLPMASRALFSGLRIATTYSMMGGIISEWLGGNQGIGVYMLRVKRMYAYDKMFASILAIVIVSLLLIKIVEFSEKKCTAWTELEY